MNSWSFKALLASCWFSVTMAQSFSIPPGLTGVSCDGTIRPDYQECYDHVLDQMSAGPIIIGPNMFEGSSYQSGNCKIRAIRCGGPTDRTFDLGSMAGSLFTILRNECGAFPAGGVNRQGDACLVVETPSNPFPGRKRDLESHASPLPRADKPVPSRETKLARREATAAARSLDLEARQCQGGTCYNYQEVTFITGVRGLEVRVCDNILPNGATCTRSWATTTTETFTVGFEVSAGLKDIVAASGSFSASTASSSTETLATAIEVQCDSGSGYIVWYPLLAVSRGIAAWVRILAGRMSRGED
ncbi:unnamed protein product [Parascedosporium putredinis]|uniref:Uncharacterized protein n=1 Tax=Parascedosporium putredinis TaxID=1442378 RepID=A0A9P1GYM5_9PEZI|nr:unnamed protein product [Parascedosporium putredinis]CAI7990260.1 unnamed protein product [Parascedosporium putredinis]